jgi:hypothetical protein
VKLGFVKPTAAPAGATAALSVGVGFLPVTGAAAGLGAVATGAAVSVLAATGALVQSRAGRALDDGRITVAGGFVTSLLPPLLAAQLNTAAQGVDSVLRTSSNVGSLRPQTRRDAHRIEVAGEIHRAALDSLRANANADTEPMLSAVRIEVARLAAGTRAALAPHVSRRAETPNSRRKPAPCVDPPDAVRQSHAGLGPDRVWIVTRTNDGGGDTPSDPLSQHHVRRTA